MKILNNSSRILNLLSLWILRKEQWICHNNLNNALYQYILFLKIMEIIRLLLTFLILWLNHPCLSHLIIPPLFKWGLVRNWILKKINKIISWLEEKAHKLMIIILMKVKIIRKPMIISDNKFMNNNWLVKSERIKFC